MKFKKIISTALALSVLCTAAAALGAETEGTVMTYTALNSEGQTYFYMGELTLTGLTGITAVKTEAESATNTDVWWNFKVSDTMFEIGTDNIMTGGGADYDGKDENNNDKCSGILIDADGAAAYNNITAMYQWDVNGDGKVYVYGCTPNNGATYTLTPTYTTDYGITTTETEDTEGRRVVTMTSSTSVGNNHRYLGAVDLTNIESLTIGVNEDTTTPNFNVMATDTLPLSIRGNGNANVPGYNNAQGYYDANFGSNNVLIKHNDNGETDAGNAATYDILTAVQTKVTSGTAYLYSWCGSSSRTLTVTATYKALKQEGFTFEKKISELKNKNLNVKVDYTYNGTAGSSKKSFDSFFATELSGEGDLKFALIITDIPENASVDSVVIENASGE